MNRRNRLRRVGLVLALLMLAAIVTGVAASATKTAVPKQLARRWWGPSDGGPIEMRMDVGPRGRVEIDQLCSPDAPPTCTPRDVRELGVVVVRGAPADHQRHTLVLRDREIPLEDHATQKIAWPRR